MKRVKSERMGVYALFAIVMLASAFGNLSQTAVNAMMPEIMGEFARDVSLGQWLTTSYMLVLGIAVPAATFLGKRFTTRQHVFIALAFFLFRSRWGLRLRACGEHPQAADSVGINVYKMRYAGVVISGALGAIGGMAYIVPPVQTWNFEVGVAGAGFLAMAVMIFGQWKPFNIFGAAMFFAVFKSLANIADSTFLAQLHWSSNIYNMMPFVASMIILAFTSKNSMAPKAEGIPYDKGSR